MKKSLIILSLILSSKNYFAQEWVDKASKPDANLYEIQKEFYKFFEGKDVTVKSTGYKAFRRWEHFVRPRVYPTGNLSVMNQTAKNYSDFLMQNPTASSSNNKSISSNNSVMSTTWIPVGPMGAPTGTAGGWPRKAGRDNFVTLHPTNPLIMYAGAAGGGLWETTNGGTSWTTNTDNLPVAAVSDLAIDPTNPNIMYLATGGGDDFLSGQPISSDGVYKTTNGGLTWAPTGLTYSVSLGRVVHKVVLDPTNSTIVFAATSTGIFRSTNSGSTWTAVSGIHCWDLKFHPTNPLILYASGSAFYLSTNGGTSFSIVSSGIPTSGSNRMAIAVTPTNPSYVYVVASKSSDSQLLGVYRSTNNGVNFTLMSSTPNIIGNACNGTSTGAGQGWYDLAIAASPITPNEIVVGGVNVWRSANGGANWTNIGCWIGNASTYVHADIHELEYSTTGTLYSSNDGGIFTFNGSNWPDLTAQRNIAQIYKIGLSGLTPNKWITGHQDNGTNIKNGANYVAALAGDGMDCFIDKTNDNYMFAEQYDGNIYRSTNGGASWASISAGLTGVGDWVTPWKQDPTVANTIYCGRVQLFKSTNYGSSWSQMGTNGSGGSMIEFAVAPSNSQVIYVLHPGSIRKTTNGGTTWTNVTNGVPAGAPTFVTVDPNDPNTAWVTVSGYTAGSKVYQTVDGGATWMNISSNLPNLPANCSVYEPGSNDRIYVGMDVGIYYKDNSSTNWTLYNAGLPNVQIMDMETSPAAPGKLYAATFGRGVYEADVVPVTAAPVPNFSYYGSICVGVNKVLVDNSSNTPTSWNWTITPNTGVTFNSTSVQNPTLNFTTPGTYTISFISGNTFGQGPVNTQTISVAVTPTITLSAPSVTVCDQTPVVVTASGSPTYSWSNSGGNAPTVTYTPSGDWTYTVTGANGGCVGTAYLSVTNLFTPVILLSTSSATVCDQDTISVTATGATSYTWSNGGGNAATVTYTTNGNFTYTVTGANGMCVSTETLSIANVSCVGIIELGANNASFYVFPNPAVDNVILKMHAVNDMDVTIELYDALGKLVIKQNASFTTDKPEYKLNIASLANGIYSLKIVSKERSSQILKIVKE